MSGLTFAVLMLGVSQLLLALAVGGLCYVVRARGKAASSEARRLLSLNAEMAKALGQETGKALRARRSA